MMLFVLTGTSDARRDRFCTRTAQTLFDACRASVKDDTLVKQAVCINTSDPVARDQCTAEAKDARDESSQLCRDQRDWRLAACDILGQGRYDPDVIPTMFDDPKNPTHPDLYFPLTVGDHWEYRGGDEVNMVDVVNETKLIAGVNCIVIRDLVMTSGDLTEATDDWYAPAKDGSTWYFGEETKTYESLDGDNPRRPELVSIDGSFKGGREGDKPGIIFLAAPTVGAVYVEEASLGNAEDVTQVLSTTYAFGSNTDLDQSVPQALADHLCAGDCVVTKNFSLLEPASSRASTTRRVSGSSSRSNRRRDLPPRRLQRRSEVHELATALSDKSAAASSIQRRSASTWTGVTAGSRRT